MNKVAYLTGYLRALQKRAQTMSGGRDLSTEGWETTTLPSGGTVSMPPKQMNSYQAGQKAQREAKSRATAMRDAYSGTSISTGPKPTAAQKEMNNKGNAYIKSKGSLANLDHINK